MTAPFDIGQPWDVIIIGTGMGGATLGYALARGGKRVLFCESGLAPGLASIIRDSNSTSENSATDASNATGASAATSASNATSASAATSAATSASNATSAHSQSLRGNYAETHFARDEAPQPAHAAVLAQAGRYQQTLEDHSGSRRNTFIPFIGAGAGGSTALYGMALERFFPADFTPRGAFPDAVDSALPDAWPISYDELAPFYEAAETLFRVRGSADPLRGGEERNHLKPSPALSPAAAELVAFFEGQQLHPYRLPMACEFVPGCSGCQGYLCAENCKNDANRMCLTPAIVEHGACLLDGCEVRRIEADHAHASAVMCHWRGRERTLRATTIVLAAGALESPRILLQSANAAWPQGLANRSGQVGKNLMRHHIDLYLIEPKLKGEFDNRQKEFAFNDFYQANGQKLGSVQSFGRLPPAAVLAASMTDDLRQGPLPWTAPLFSLVKPFLKPALRKLVERRLILATTIEDLPYADNQISMAPAADGTSQLRMHYRVRKHDQARIDAMRALMKSTLKTYAFSLIKQAENNQRIAHACGTCRFGDDPDINVLDKNNRAHGLRNLYVVDSSFFPSSGGTNPSLTIAANALRVAAHLLHPATTGEAP
jgi:choline dehydrogenase-like flavoprotein